MNPRYRRNPPDSPALPGRFVVAGGFAGDQLFRLIFYWT